MSKARYTKAISTAVILAAILTAQAIGSIHMVYAAERQEPTAPSGISAMEENTQDNGALSADVTIKETHVTSDGDLLIIMSDGSVKNAGKVAADSTTVLNEEDSSSKADMEITAFLAITVVWLFLAVILLVLFSR